MEYQSNNSNNKFDIETNEFDKKSKGIRDYIEYSENPFIDDIIVKTTKKVVAISSRPIDIVNQKTGEIENTAFLHVKRELDSEKFVKIFIAQLQFIFELSTRALKIVAFFMNALRINNDKVYFDMPDCMKYTGYNSRQTVFSGLAELLDKGVIAKSTKNHIYFINPRLIFNGDRLVIVNDFRKNKNRNNELSKSIPKLERKKIKNCQSDI